MDFGVLVWEVFGRPQAIEQNGELKGEVRMEEEHAEEAGALFTDRQGDQRGRSVSKQRWEGA